MNIIFSFRFCYYFSTTMDLLYIFSNGNSSSRLLGISTQNGSFPSLCVCVCVPVHDGCMCWAEHSSGLLLFRLPVFVSRNTHIHTVKFTQRLQENKTIVQNGFSTIPEWCARYKKHTHKSTYRMCVRAVDLLWCRHPPCLQLTEKEEDEKKIIWLSRFEQQKKVLNKNILPATNTILLTTYVCCVAAMLRAAPVSIV